MGGEQNRHSRRQQQLIAVKGAGQFPCFSVAKEERRCLSDRVGLNTAVTCAIVSASFESAVDTFSQCCQSSYVCPRTLKPHLRMNQVEEVGS